jgi:hypothetical protein
MRPNRWDAWEPQAPPDDFAGRTVATALEQRQARRRTGKARWGALAAAAAMMVGGAAWGLSAWSGRNVVPLSPTPAAPAPDPARSIEPLARRFPPADAGSPALGTIPSRPRRPRAPPEIGAPDAGRKVIVPACDCVPDQVMCTCF